MTKFAATCASRNLPRKKLTSSVPVCAISSTSLSRDAFGQLPELPCVFVGLQQLAIDQLGDRHAPKHDRLFAHRAKGAGEIERASIGAVRSRVPPPAERSVGHSQMRVQRDLHLGPVRRRRELQDRAQRPQTNWRSLPCMRNAASRRVLQQARSLWPRKACPRTNSDAPAQPAGCCRGSGWGRRGARRRAREGRGALPSASRHMRLPRSWRA